MIIKNSDIRYATYLLWLWIHVEGFGSLFLLLSENNALKTELMYYKQKDKLTEDKDKNKPEPTPVEKLANSSSLGKSILFTHMKDNEKKD